MGYVTVKGLVGEPQKSVVREVEFLADSGPFHTAIPPELAMELGIRVEAKIPITLANKQEIAAGIGLAYIKIEDRESVLPVVVLDVPKPLLGVTTFEGLGLKVDPTTGKVEHSRPFGVALLSAKSLKDS